MSSLERVPRSDDLRPILPQEILDELARQLRIRLGDAHERFGIHCENELNPEAYKLLKGLDEEDVKLLKEAMALLKGQRLHHDASDVAKDLQHLLTDYRSARSIGRILKIVWIAIAGLVGVLIAVIKGLPDFLDILRGWIK